MNKIVDLYLSADSDGTEEALGKQSLVREGGKTMISSTLPILLLLVLLLGKPYRFVLLSTAIVSR